MIVKMYDYLNVANFSFQLKLYLVRYPDRALVLSEV